MEEYQRYRDRFASRLQRGTATASRAFSPSREILEEVEWGAVPADWLVSVSTKIAGGRLLFSRISDKVQLLSDPS